VLVDAHFLILFQAGIIPLISVRGTIQVLVNIVGLGFLFAKDTVISLTLVGRHLMHSE